MEKIEKQQYLSGHKRKALDTDESAELQSIIKYLINIVEELRDENLMLHKQMDAVCQDVESMKCLLERDLPKTNYTSTNNNNVQVEEKKDKEKETIHEDDILVMIEDKDNDKDKEKDKEKSCNNNNNNNNINNKSGWEAEVKKKIEEEKNRKAKKRHPCENCKRWSHKIDTCWRKHPEIAPLDWKKKAEELKKAAEERKKYEEDMDFRSSLAWASASKKDKIVRTKPIRPEMEEWEEGRRRFEEVEKFMREGSWNLFFCFSEITSKFNFDRISKKKWRKKKSRDLLGSKREAILQPLFRSGLFYH